MKKTSISMKENTKIKTILLVLTLAVLSFGIVAFMSPESTDDNGVEPSFIAEFDPISNADSTSGIEGIQKESEKEKLAQQLKEKEKEQARVNNGKKVEKSKKKTRKSTAQVGKKEKSTNRYESKGEEDVQKFTDALFEKQQQTQKEVVRKPVTVSASTTNGSLQTGQPKNPVISKPSTPEKPKSSPTQPVWKQSEKKPERTHSSPPSTRNYTTTSPKKPTTGKPAVKRPPVKPTAPKTASASSVQNILQSDFNQLIHLDSKKQKGFVNSIKGRFAKPNDKCIKIMNRPSGSQKSYNCKGIAKYLVKEGYKLNIKEVVLNDKGKIIRVMTEQVKV